MGQHGKNRVWAQWGNLPEPDKVTHRPQVIQAGNGDELLQLIEEKKPVKHDEIGSQIKELIKIRHPKEKLSQDEIEKKYEEYLGTREPHELGAYVYYPWSNRLIHILDEEEFVELRTSRNKYKITHEEQERLREKKVGIVGLSVGHSVAMALAAERIAGTLRIADYDSLELTNLNRIRSGLHSIGLPKVVMVAREIAEIDPFIKVELYKEGITTENIDGFLGEGLDLVIEVCDSLPIKILARLKAREKGIPVVMDTSDRGMIDVERFDHEPERAILHGKCGVSDIGELEELKPGEKMELLMRMVDFEQLSERMKYSFSELGKTLTTWPQLASDVISGGGTTAKITRQILLGEEVPSNRYYFDNATTAD